jgi:hypothetical protein
MSLFTSMYVVRSVTNVYRDCMCLCEVSSITACVCVCAVHYDRVCLVCVQCTIWLHVSVCAVCIVAACVCVGSV